jgi:DNA-binding PadR family transcriptional regulator
VERRSTLSLTEWTTLGLLAERPRHGYDIAAELHPDAPLGQVWHAPRHAVYRALERLTGLGHVETRRTEAGDAAPRRTVYGTTPRGRRMLHDWLDTPVEHLRDVRSALLLKLTIAERLDHPTATLVERQRTRFDPLLDARTELSPAREPIDPVDRWRHHAARAIDAFLRELADEDRRR